MPTNSRRSERLLPWFREFDRPRQALRQAVLLAAGSQEQLAVLDRGYARVADDDLTALVRVARGAVGRVAEHLLSIVADLDRLRT